MNEPKPAANSKTLIQIVVGLWAGVLLGALVLGVLAFTGVVPLFGNATSSDEAPAQPLRAQLESGTMAPDVALTDLKGGAVHLADFHGKVVAMNFWATWCGPCIQEMPMFQEYQDRYPELVVLGVNAEESAEIVTDFTDKLQVNYPLVLDVGAKMAREFRVNFLPTTIFVDQNGEVRFRHYGIIAPEQMDYYLETLGLAPND